MVIERCRIEKWRMFQRQMQKKTKEEKEPNLRSSAPLQLLFAKLFSLAPSTFQTVQNEKRERERTIPNQNIYKKKLPFKYLNSKKKKTKERGYTTLLFYLQFIYQPQFTIWDFSRD